MFRRPAVRTLLIEAAVIAIGIATAVTIIYFKSRPTPVHVQRRLAGQEQNVSQNDRVQYAPALALDPANPRVLLAGSSQSELKVVCPLHRRLSVPSLCEADRR